MVSKRILVAALDWGMGHTTRCIPIVAHLAAKGHHVIFAGNEAQRLLMRAACPGVDEAALPGYGVSYSRRALMAGLVAQLPKIALAIRAERHWLRELVKQEAPIHGVISDNRYGLYHPDVPCVILTHQLNIRSGMGRLADAAVRARHDRMLARFAETWIVDDVDINLAGNLSRRESMPQNARHIGLLSQCATSSSSLPTPAAKHILILLSGPEPQRTILSGLLWEQALRLTEPVVFVEGNRSVSRSAPPHIRHIPIAARSDVPALIASARLVVCRSGYSTLMDLAALNAPAILIPTPGQTEQEYLAGHAQRKNWVISAQQKAFSLRGMLDAAAGSSFRPMAAPEAFLQYRDVLDEWAAAL